MKKLQIETWSEIGDTKLHIKINGITDRKSIATHSTWSAFPLEVRLVNKKAIKEITSYSYRSISESLSSLRFQILTSNIEFSFSFILHIPNSFLYISNNSNSKFNILLSTSLDNWANPYTAITFFETIIQTVSNGNFQFTADTPKETYNTRGVYFTFPIEDFDSPINIDIEKALRAIDELTTQTTLNLLSKLDERVLTTYFRFPDSIKAACKQYLVYFSQFLMDAGIEVDTEIKEELNNTLFKIIPKNGDESLEKIKQALTEYLNAPAISDFDVQAAKVNNIAVIQWHANTLHLKSQLALALAENRLNEATIQYKETTIQQLQLTNYQLIEKLKSTSTEDLVEGVVSLKKYENKILIVNLPEIFRRLKRRFKS